VLFILFNSLSGLFGKALAGNVPTSLSSFVLILLSFIVLGVSVDNYLRSRRPKEA